MSSFRSSCNEVDCYLRLKTADLQKKLTEINRPRMVELAWK